MPDPWDDHSCGWKAAAGEFLTGGE